MLHVRVWTILALHVNLTFQTYIFHHFAFSSPSVCGVTVYLLCHTDSHLMTDMLKQ